LNYVFGTLLTAYGQLKWLNRISIAAIAFNLACNAWLIHPMGQKHRPTLPWQPISMLAVAYIRASHKRLAFSWNELAPGRMLKYLIWLVLGTLAFQLPMSWPLQFIAFSGWVMLGCLFSGIIGKSLFRHWQQVNKPHRKIDNSLLIFRRTRYLAKKK
jgi:O-antigen/teichoic acid export membrane protein